MNRRLLAVIGGILLGSLVIMIIEMLIHQMYPLPEGIDKGDKETMKQFVASLPTGALMGVLLAWASGAFTGGWFAAKVSQVSPMYHSLIVGMGLMVMAIMNMIAIPHPGWFWVPGLLIHLPIAWLGGRIVGKQ